MSRSLLQTANSSAQNVDVSGVIGLGRVLRRYGCNIRLNGDAVEIEGAGYYTISAAVVATPTAAEDVTVAVYKDGVAVPAATATQTVGTAGDTVTLPIETTVRLGCCDGASALTLVLESGAGVIDNVSARIEKE